jgi:hypothetical protein
METAERKFGLVGELDGEEVVAAKLWRDKGRNLQPTFGLSFDFGECELNGTPFECGYVFGSKREFEKFGNELRRMWSEETGCGSVGLLDFELVRGFVLTADGTKRELRFSFPADDWGNEWHVAVVLVDRKLYYAVQDLLHG